MHCPRCQATQYIKYGMVNNVQRYRCNNCQYQWTRTTPRGHPIQNKRLAVLLYCHGISMNAISKLFSISVTSVLKWIRTFAQQHAQKEQVSKGQCVDLEFDEMWHYIGNKKINSGYGKCLIETPDT